MKQKVIAIIANKNCKKCGGKAYCQMLVGGCCVCNCITDQIRICNNEGIEIKPKVDGNYIYLKEEKK